MTGNRVLMRRWAIRLTAHAGKVMPDARAEWATAIANELDSIANDHAAFRWAMGAVTTSYKERVWVMRIIMTRAFLAACTGVFYALCARSFWGFYAGHIEVARTDIRNLPADDLVAVHLLTIFSQDLIMNIVIALPFAAFLWFRPSLNYWRYAAVAGIAAIVSVYSESMHWWPGIAFRVNDPGFERFWLGFATVLLSLPTAFAGIRAIRPSPQPS
jgi:hypothetical protein